MNKKQKPLTKSKQTGNIRIIAGKYRGRKLPVLLAEGLRPTTDRVKETVFNWLMPYLPDSACLDCFAGAGSLGFEAASRGAAHVTLVELNKQAAQQLENNRQLLQANNIGVQHRDALHFLQQVPEHKFDLVFLDPPFRKGLAEQASKLLTHGWLANNALIYVEMANDSQEELPTNWQLLKEKTAGQVSYRLYSAA